MLSVITPCYNSAKTIKKTLDSVKTQNAGELEHIIIDGASTDGTLDILNEYKASVDYDVIIVSEPDGGIYDAMNKGIGLARGELIGIINSDDWYDPDALNTIIKAYSGGKYVIIYGMIRTYDDNRLRTMEFYHHDFLIKRMINHPGCFVTRSVYEDYGLYDTSYKSSADYEWAKRCMDRGVVFTPVFDVLANVSLGGMSASNIGFRETLKLQHEWGEVSSLKYYAYTLKSLIGDCIRK